MQISTAQSHTTPLLPKSNGAWCFLLWDANGYSNPKWKCLKNLEGPCHHHFHLLMQFLEEFNLEKNPSNPMEIVPKQHVQWNWAPYTYSIVLRIWWKDSYWRQWILNYGHNHQIKATAGHSCLEATSRSRKDLSLQHEFRESLQHTAGAGVEISGGSALNFTALCIMNECHNSYPRHIWNTVSWNHFVSRDTELLSFFIQEHENCVILFHSSSCFCTGHTKSCESTARLFRLLNM